MASPYTSSVEFPGLGMWDSFTPPPSQTSEASKTAASAWMYGPDGKKHLIPNEKIKEATESGGQLAIPMRDPNNVLRWVPKNRVRDALQAKGRLDLSALPTPQHPSIRQHIWDALSGLTGMGGMATESAYVPPEVQDVQAQQVTDVGKRMDERKAAGWGPGYRAVALVAEGAGVPVSMMEQSSKEGDTGGVVVGAATLPAIMAVSHAVSRAVPAIRERLPGPKAVDAASNFSAALEMGGKADKGTRVYEDIGPITNDVREEAARQGLTEADFSGRQGYDKAEKLTDAVRNRYDDYWRNEIIAPIRDEPAPKAAVAAAKDLYSSMSRDARLTDAIQQGTPFGKNVQQLMNLANTVLDHPTVGGLDNLRVELNRLSANLLSMSEADQYTATLSRQSVDAAAESVRNALYEDVARRYGGRTVNGESVGIPVEKLREIQRLHGAIIRADNLMKQTSRAMSSAASSQAAPATFAQRMKPAVTRGVLDAMVGGGAGMLMGNPKAAIGGALLGGGYGVRSGLRSMAPFSVPDLELFNTRMQRVIKGATAGEGYQFPKPPITPEYVGPKVEPDMRTGAPPKLKAGPIPMTKVRRPIRQTHPGLPPGPAPQLALPESPSAQGAPRYGGLQPAQRTGPHRQLPPTTPPPESMPYRGTAGKSRTDIISDKLAAQGLPGGTTRVPPRMKWTAQGKPEFTYETHFTAEQERVIAKARSGKKLTHNEELMMEAIRRNPRSVTGLGEQGQGGVLVREKQLPAPRSGNPSDEWSNPANAH